MVRRVATVLASVLLVVGWLPAAGAAGSKPEPTPRPIGGLSFADETEVQVVNVDVFVRDKNGQPVTNLSRDDFVVQQDGTEMPLSNFALITEDVARKAAGDIAPIRPVLGPTPTPTPASDEADELPDVKPIFMVLYIDNENLRPLDRNRVLRKVRDFVTENLHPPAQMMVVTYQKSLKILQPFTPDPRAVIDALRSVRTDTGGRSERDSTRSDIIDSMRQYEEESKGRNMQSNPRMTANYMLRKIAAFADEESNNLLFSVNAVREVTGMLAGLPGRKSLVYISDGLPMVPGVDLLYEYAQIFGDNSALALVSRYERSKVFDSLTQSANAQGVRLYAIDCSGLQVRGDFSAESRYSTNILASSIGGSNYQDALRYMADNTGGLAIINTNNVGPGLEKIRADMYTYYSLGYTLSASGSDRIHRVSVEVPGHPEYDLRYRRRFVEKSLESRVRDKVMTALLFEVNKNPMQVEVDQGDPAPATSQRWTVPIHVSFPLENVALIPTGTEYVGRVLLFVAARDTAGKQSDLQQQQHDIRIPAADYDEAKTQRFGIDVSLLMEPGSYNVVVGLMDQVTRQDSYAKMRVYLKP